MDETKWLISREIPNLRRYARSLTNSADEADDLVQDCLERAIRKRALWRRKGSLRGWLFRILYNVHLNGGRARRRAQSTVDIDDTPDALATDTAPDKRVECWRVAEALDQLPSDQREALLLVSLENLPYDEAADALGIPIGTLRSRVSRGRESLRALAGRTSDQNASARGSTNGQGHLRRVK